jgi:hypothetical protein
METYFPFLMFVCSKCYQNQQLVMLCIICRSQTLLLICVVITYVKRNIVFLFVTLKLQVFNITVKHVVQTLF